MIIIALFCCDTNSQNGQAPSSGMCESIWNRQYATSANEDVRVSMTLPSQAGGAFYSGNDIPHLNHPVVSIFLVLRVLMISHIPWGERHRAIRRLTISCRHQIDLLSTFSTPLPRPSCSETFHGTFERHSFCVLDSVFGRTSARMWLGISARSVTRCWLLLQTFPGGT